MFCEPYRQALTNAAASGGPLPHEVAAHVVVCTSCASAFADEQVLYASIDHSLCTTANAEVPGSLIPRVRAALPQSEFLGKRFSWRPIVVPLAAFCLAASFLLIPRFTSQNRPDRSGLVVASQERKIAVRAQNQPPVATENISKRSTSAGKPLQNVRPPPDLNIKLEPSTQSAIAQLVRMAHEQPEIAESLSRKSEPAYIAIKPIEVAEIHWEPLSSDAEGKN
jgi:hypothetical protein